MITGAIGDGIVLVGRVSLVLLFLIFGWRKLRDYPGTVSQMVADRLPMPSVVAAVAIVMELPVAFAVGVGAFTRPLALLMALYTLGTSMAEHRYWTKPRGGRLAALEDFYKNLGIMGGFLLLSVTGGGAYSVDALWRLAAR